MAHPGTHSNSPAKTHLSPHHTGPHLRIDRMEVRILQNHMDVPRTHRLRTTQWPPKVETRSSSRGSTSPTQYPRLLRISRCCLATRPQQVVRCHGAQNHCGIIVGNGGYRLFLRLLRADANRKEQSCCCEISIAGQTKLDYNNRHRP